METALRPTTLLPLNQAFAYHLLKVAQENFSRCPGELDPLERTRAEEQARQSLRIESLVLESSEAREVVVSPARVEQALSAVRGRYADRAEMEADLDRNDLDAEALRVALYRELRFAAILNRVGTRHGDISPVDLEIHYQLNRERFVRPETRTVRHILVTVNPDFPENGHGVAEARLRDIAGQIHTDPERFAALAQQHSECPSALHGGLIGTIPRGKLYTALDEVLFALPEGGLSDVVESELGLHLLRCDKIHPAAELGFAEVAPRLREQMQERLRRQHQRAWIRQLLAAAQGGPHG